MKVFLDNSEVLNYCFGEESLSCPNNLKNELTRYVGGMCSMKCRGFGSSSLISIIFLLSILIGCSKPVLRMPKPLPDTIKRYTHITLRSGVSGMQNTGIHLSKGDLYSVLATGSIDMCPGGTCVYHDVRPEDGWPLMVRIGNHQYFRPLQRGINAETATAYQSGNLFVGYRAGKVNPYGEPFNPEYYHDDTGAFHMDVIVWQTDDFVEIADVFESMKAENPKNKAVLDAIYHANIRKSLHPTVPAVKEAAVTPKVGQEVSGAKEAAVSPKVGEKVPGAKVAAISPKVKETSTEIEDLLMQSGPQLIDEGKYEQVLELIEDLPGERRKHVQIQTLACFANLKAYLSEADQVKKLNWWALRKKLVNWGDREATPLLVAFLKAEDGYLRKYAAELLGHIGDERALEALREVGEHDESHRTRRYARWAYEEISGEKF
jgi:hypothetical protein